MKKKALPGLFLMALAASCLFSGFLSAQEVLKSAEEEYYDFLALQGITSRPSLNYRTLSDSVWDTGGNPHPWQDQKLQTQFVFFESVSLRIYGPELFTSYNTAAPYGYNDGALWQGRGFNAAFSGGIRFEGRGVEATVKPLLTFSQNAAFDLMKPEKMTGGDFSGRGDTYGYFWNIVDAPQRFGNKPFVTFDWGDSEIRYTWKTLTAGFGTQALWLGPARLNPILHSNNAASYPKFDIGLRRQRVTIPWLDWYAGDVEARIWVGQLTESDYFDNASSNNHTMFHGLSFAYAPSFLPGLTLFVNRVCLVPWEWANLKYMFPSNNNTIEDQKASFGLSWFFTQAGFEVYGEIGVDDYVPDGILGYFRDAIHTTVYTFGFQKNISILDKKTIYGKLILEITWMEMSQDFQFSWPYSFYFHHNIKQGYTNGGQWLGSGLGSGGNSQYLGFLVYYPKGSVALFITRNNPDNTYLYKNAIYDTATNNMLRVLNKDHNRANFNIGISSEYFLKSHFFLFAGCVYNLIINPHYLRTQGPDGTNWPATGSNTLIHNFSFVLSFKWII